MVFLKMEHDIYPFELNSKKCSQKQRVVEWMWAAAAKHPSSAIQVMMPPPLGGDVHSHMVAQML